MNSAIIAKPKPGEYPPYFDAYIARVPEGPFPELLSEQRIYALQLLESIPEEKKDHRYAEGKWSIRELIMHITDVERVMFYRALVASRGDSKTVIYPMDDALYVQHSGAQRMSMQQILAEFHSTRKASEEFFAHLSPEQLDGTVNGSKYSFSARSLAYIIAGHTDHHLDILKKRYL